MNSDMKSLLERLLDGGDLCAAEAGDLLRRFFNAKR